jgi:hypothetical protein
VWPSVLVPGRATRGDHCSGPSSGQEHHGLPTVALGNPVLHEHQHCQRHQNQPFHLRLAGQCLDVSLYYIKPPNCIMHQFSRTRRIDHILDMVKSPSCLSNNDYTYFLQLGIPHCFVMTSYQYKFQDEDQTKIKGSIKYVLTTSNIYSMHSCHPSLILCVT